MELVTWGEDVDVCVEVLVWLVEGVADELELVLRSEWPVTVTEVDVGLEVE